MLIEFTPTGVCTKKINFELEEGRIYNLKFHGGCPGNLLAISKLLEGSDALKVAQLLRGNHCAGRKTSCTDQLSIAIEQAVMSQRKAS